MDRGKRALEDVVIRHAVFDLDGTLIDSIPLCAEILNAMLSDRGATRRVSHAQTRPHVTAGGEAMVAALLGCHCGDPAEAIADFRRRYRALPTPPSSLYPGVREALFRLVDACVGLALWSNKPQALCDKVIGDLRLAELFSAVVGTGPGIPLKPDPTGFDRALALAGGSRPTSCYVGDSQLDHEAARRAGVPFVRLTHGYGQYDRPWPGAFSASGLEEIPAIVSRILTSSERPMAKARGGTR